ncbi:hypothetical protein ACP3TC_13090 [Winslowiella sp. 2C04]|uniref:hypothetical protein n=1 Tax=Winslowiella sp. 2C04 TaxID=3416179 RepID=UPI003CEE4433
MTFFSRKLKGGVYILLFIFLAFLLTFSENRKGSAPGIFPYRICKAELKLLDFRNDNIKTANIRLFFLFNSNQSGNMEFSGKIFDEQQEYLTRGRIDFNYQYNKNIMEITGIHRTLSDRDMSSLLGATLPEYLSVDKGSMIFSTRIISSSQVVVTRYNEPIYVMTCNK